jgi:hypothetical protein
VNTIQLNDGSIHRLSNYFLLTKLRLAASIIGKDILGFDPFKIGLHSLRSGAAMAVYLAGIPIPTIKLTGRWATEAFMDYIRPQIAKFSPSVSKAMISNTSFFTIPINNNNPCSQSALDPLQKYGLHKSFLTPHPIIV